jgi:uncharacterized repeat protein (TIGR02543 family)
MIKSGFFIVVLASILLMSGVSLAWDSVGYVTHEAVADDAISPTVLPSNEYPDLYMYEQILRAGSESEAPHLDGRYNGGNVIKWWSDKATLSYNASSFSQAYKQIGQIAHLTQDQAVPAHAANIKHGIWWLHFDYFESYADQNYYISNPSNGYLIDSFPFDYYQSLQDDTRNLLTSWTKPSTGEQYWVAAPTAPPIGQDATGGDRSGGEAPWGNYGGSSGPHGDIYLNWLLQTESPQISNDQISKAISHTAGVFAAASRKLPPLIDNLVIVPISISPQIDVNNGTQISFQMFENRKDTVKIYITVDSPTGTAIKDMNGNIYNGLSYTLLQGTSLPWEGNYTLNWDGTLEDGTFPSDGEHTLYVQLEDFDGNLSTVSTHLFTIYSHPVLTISKTGSGTVTSYAAGIDCGNDCSESYSHGDSVTLTASPASGWSFNGWTNCDSPSGNTCNMTMDGDKTVTAEFTPVSTWSIQTLDGSGNVGQYTSIAMDASGATHISYYDSANGALKYITNSSGSWASPVTLDSTGNVGLYSSIDTDSSGYVHISYYDASNGNLKYITNSSGFWATPVTVDSAGNVGRYSSIAIDMSGKVHISYIDGTNHDLKYATNVSGAWVKTAVDSTGFIDEQTSIAVDASGRVHISYYDSSGGSLKYATNASGVWISTTVDSAGDVGPYSSIALDSVGNAHISYIDWDNEYLKYVTNASGVWGSPVTVDNSGSIDGRTSIAIDSSDHVHISYFDWYGQNLKYATNATGIWVTNTIDSTGDVGRDSSIGVDLLSGVVHISYYDATNHDLKHAATNKSVDRYTLIVSKSGSGSGTITGSLSVINCGAVCRESYDKGTRVTLSAVPDVNSTFTGWSGGGCSGTGTCQVTLGGDTNITADFSVLNYTITTAYGSGGIISPPSPVINYGSRQSFAIIPSAGYHIDDVLVDGISQGAVTAYTFTNVTSSHIIQANFVMDTFLLASSAGAGGSISPSQVTVNYGDSRSFSITPDTGYHIADVLVDGLSVGAVNSYTFSGVTADHLIEALFAPDCTPVASDDTTCDGIDDDCDGLFDEDYVISPTTCGVGACSGNTGQLECQNGSVIDTCDPFAGAASDDSLCNGIDDDCDGAVDEDYVQTPVLCGIGACLASGQRECQGGIEVDVCVPGSPGTEGPPGDITCSDSLDNDCDGLTDNNDPSCIPSDADNDGIPDDGDFSGVAGDNPCRGGNTANCDDNCLSVANPNQDDTDSDGVGDACDNCYLTSNPGQQDTDGDGYGNMCDADLDNDGFVGPNDYTLFGNAWWSDTTSPDWNPDADFDSDDFVGPNDYTIFGSRWWSSEPWY